MSQPNDLTQPGSPREETFSVTEGILTRLVTPAVLEGRKRHKPYDHTCDRDVFERVCHAIDELNGASFIGEEIRDLIASPHTQVMVAIAFLKERGIIVPAQRKRSVASSDDVYLDAMTEWHALRELGTTI